MEPGIFWIGTNKGLFQYNDHQNYFTEYRTEKFFSDEGHLNALAFDEAGLLWLGSNTGELVALDITKSQV